jgi:hypothetical protein
MRYLIKQQRLIDGEGTEVVTGDGDVGQGQQFHEHDWSPAHGVCEDNEEEALSE